MTDMTETPDAPIPDRANVDAAEVAKFDAMAARWWDPDGAFRPLHLLNPLRLQFIEDRARLADTRVVDVGCGGGILAESMARRGAHVIGIDLAESALAVARMHMIEAGVEVDYRAVTAGTHAEECPGAADVVTCMELLEHVPDPAELIADCARMARPGGHLFFSTLNRTPKAWLLAIISAEYIMNMLPRGTHEYARFIRPSELGSWLRAAGLQVREIRGIRYHPLRERFSLTRDVSVNYLVHATRSR